MACMKGGAGTIIMMNVNVTDLLNNWNIEKYLEHNCSCRVEPKPFTKYYGILISKQSL